MVSCSHMYDMAEEPLSELLQDNSFNDWPFVMEQVSTAGVEKSILEVARR